MKKVLIVEDDAGILDVLTIILEPDYTVEAVTKGKEAYTKIYSFKPDLILLDVLMSGSDGRDICKKIKEDPETKSIPVIMMSAHPSAKKSALEMGANSFLEKPFDIKHLRALVKKHIQS